MICLTCQNDHPAVMWKTACGCCRWGGSRSRQASKQEVAAAQNRVVAVEAGQEGRFRIDFEDTANRDLMEDGDIV